MTETKDWLLPGRARSEVGLDRIHDIAAALLAERGVEGFDVEVIARRAGCSRATLYRLTGGKKAMLTSVVLHQTATLVAEVERRTRDLDPRQRMVEVLVVALAQIRENQVLRDWFLARRVNHDHALIDVAIADAQRTFGTEISNQLMTRWMYRVVLTLLAWPMADEAEERAVLEAATVSARQLLRDSGEARSPAPLGNAT